MLKIKVNQKEKSTNEEEKEKRDLDKLTIEKDKLIKIVDRKIDEDIRQFNNFLKEYRDDKVKNKIN